VRASSARSLGPILFQMSFGFGVAHTSRSLQPWQKPPLYSQSSGLSGGFDGLSGEVLAAVLF
jgi:hypothetical protein